MADAGLDDGADERAVVNAGEFAGSRDAELRALVGVEEGRRQGQVEQLQTGEGLQLEEIAGDRGQQVGQRWADVVQRPGERDLGGAAFAVPVLRRARAGQAGVLQLRSRSVIGSTLAANCSRSSSVSPGTRRKVPVDCSPAMVAPPASRGKAVSIQYVAQMRGD